MTKNVFLISTFLLSLCYSAFGQDTLLRMDTKDRICLHEALLIGKEYGKKMWSEWEKVPFTILLVEDSLEFLINHPQPPAEFKNIGYDKYLKRDVYVRKKTFSSKILTVVPDLGGYPTICIGKPHEINKKSSQWILTLLGEHFIQLHMSRKDYQTSIKSLGLGTDDVNDETWMLFYKFPYKDAALNTEFSITCKALLEAMKAMKTKKFKEKYTLYLQARANFVKLLSPQDYNYFSFKLWRAGVGSYTEYRFAEFASKHHKFSKDCQSLADYEKFESIKDHVYSELLNELSLMSLKSYKRIAFHAFGAAEAILLDYAQPKWHKKYFTDKFYMEKYHQK